MGKSLFKFANASVLLGMLYCMGILLCPNTLLAREGEILGQQTPILTNEQLFLEKMVLSEYMKESHSDEKFAREYGQYSEQYLIDLVSSLPVQFKSTITKIYAQNNDILLWNNEAERRFLHDYAALAISGISKHIMIKLSELYQMANRDRLTYDILLTDAFLGYLYYSKNVLKYAQKWLYSSNTYESLLPNENDIQDWLNAVRNNQSLDFILKLGSENTLYRQTLYQLEAIVAAKKLDINQIYKLAINSQRLRILPNFYNGIFVNIPSYQLHYYRDGHLLINSRVIVGKPERKTPVMYSKLANVVVNPPWIPTSRLINEDLVPKIKRDPSYVERNGYTISDKNGKTVDPYSIDWESITSYFPYHIRQAPGDSALGQYKFNMPSADAIYLHDTPNHNLFKKKNRALSSGCVRVEESAQLANILLKEAGWTTNKTNEVLNTKKTVSARVFSDNPVYLYYVTAWMDNGKLYTAPDIYHYDVVPTDLNNINWNMVREYLTR